MNNLESIMALIEQGETEKGLGQLKVLAKKCSDEEKFYITNYYVQQGFLDDALQLAKELFASYPEEGEIRMMLAEVYTELDEEEQAIEVLNDMTENDSFYPSSLLLLADLYQIQGYDEVAEQKLLKAKAMLPNEPVVTFALAEFYLSHENYYNSINYYRHLISDHEEINNVNIHLRLAECLSGLGEWEESITYYEKGLEKTTEIYAMFQYATVLVKAELELRAIKVLNEIKELAPHFTGLYILLANAYEKEEMLQEAYDVMQEGLKVDEYNIDLYVACAKVAIKQQKEVEAQELLEQAVALEPNHTEGMIMLSHLYLNGEKYEEELQLLEDAMKNGEYDPQFDWDLASTKKQLEMFDEALKHYQEAYTSFKSDISFLEEYGYFLIEEGKREEAAHLFERALAIDPTLTHVEEILQDLR